MPGYEGRYEVSDQGRVRSLRWMVERRTEPLLLKGFLQRGYRRVLIGGRNRSVHHLVLEAFVGPRPAGLVTGHLNGRRDDNRPTNLAWITPTENQAHRILHGTTRTGDNSPARLHPESRPRGAKHWKARLTEADVLAMRAAVAAGATQRSQADRFGVATKTVSQIVTGRGWRHLPMPGAGSSDGGWPW